MMKRLNFSNSSLSFRNGSTVGCFLLTLLFLIACLNPSTAQTKGEDPEVYSFVEKMPEFPGGQEAMMQHLGKSIKYPAEARSKNIEGTVILQFVIDEHGKIRDIAVKRGIGGGCDEEAVRAVRSMPDWIPAMHLGKKVPFLFTLPVKFQYR